MKFSFLNIILFTISVFTNPFICESADLAENDTIKIQLEKARELIDNGNEEGALNIYLSILEDNPTQYNALWKTSLIYTRKGRKHNDGKKQAEYYKTAKYYAQKAIDAHPDKARSNYAYGVISLVLADNMSNSSDRINLIWKIKEHGEKALELDPDYAPAWHLMGLWHSNIAQLSRRERLAARIMYGGLPGGASEDKAEQFFKKAVELRPSFILFKLDLARHYQETKQPDKALTVLESILEMQPVSESEHLEMEKARERYNQLM